jgi:CubicO group peptidase (beta-lactamase class C family)
MTEEYEVPAGGGLSTVHDFFRFAEACRRGGELDGARILSPAMVKRARTIATGDMPNGLWTYARQMRGWREFPANMGPGFFVRGEGLFPHPFGALCSPETFGGFGAGTNCFWIDPQRDLVSVFFSVGGLEESRSVERHGRYADLVQASVVN